MKKILTLILAVALMLGALVSCTGTGDSDKTTPSTSSDAVTTGSADVTTEAPSDTDNSAAAEALRTSFLAKANEVVVDDDSVTFTDASGKESVTIKKNPKNVVNLYASFTTLWYEAGGKVAGLIGGSSSVELYKEYIGRDITADEGVTTVATSSSGKKWATETIVAMKPDLIICSTAMSGYKTIEAPAAAAGIPVIAMSYNDFSDYLKWFKVFCNLNGQPELWDTVAMPALDKVVDVLCRIPENPENAPKVFAMFSATKDNITANTSNTVLGGMISEMQAVNISDADNTSGADRIEINMESVFAADPDMIVVQCHASKEDDAAQLDRVYGGNAVWQSLRAVKEGKVYFLEPHLFHYKPNSRFADAYVTLAKILYPEIDFDN